LKNSEKASFGAPGAKLAFSKNIRVYKFHAYNKLIFLRGRSLLCAKDGDSRFFLKKKQTGATAT